MINPFKIADRAIKNTITTIRRQKTRANLFAFRGDEEPNRRGRRHYAAEQRRSDRRTLRSLRRQEAEELFNRTCTRPRHRIGPCNGLPRADCPQLDHAGL